MRQYIGIRSVLLWPWGPGTPGVFARKLVYSKNRMWAAACRLAGKNSSPGSSRLRSKRSRRKRWLFVLRSGFLGCGRRSRLSFTLWRRIHRENVGFQFLERRLSQSHPELFDIVNDDLLAVLRHLIELQRDRHCRAGNNLRAKFLRFYANFSVQLVHRAVAVVRDLLEDLAFGVVESGRPLVTRAPSRSFCVLSCILGLLSPQVVSPDHVKKGLKIYISKAHKLRRRRRKNHSRRIDRNCRNTTRWRAVTCWLRRLASCFGAGAIHRITNRIPSGVPPIAAWLRISIFGIDPLHCSWRSTCSALTALACCRKCADGNQNR